MGSDYEARQAQEKAQRRAVADAFAVLAGDVAALLGGTFQRNHDPDAFYWCAGSGNISIPGDVPVLLHVSRTVPTGKGPRLVASAVLPRDKRGDYIRFSDVMRELPDGRKASDVSLEITADLAKGADKIAADIRRRLLPDATMATAAVLRVVQQRDAFQMGAMALAEELAPLVGDADGLAYTKQRDPKAQRFTLRLRSLPGYGSVEIHGPDSVEVKVSGNAAQARAILAALAQLAKGAA